MRRERRFEVLRAPRAEHRAEVEGATRQNWLLMGSKDIAQGRHCSEAPRAPHAEGHRFTTEGATASMSEPYCAEIDAGGFSEASWGGHAPRATAARPGGVRAPKATL